MRNVTCMCIYVCVAKSISGYFWSESLIHSAMFIPVDSVIEMEIDFCALMCFSTQFHWKEWLNHSQNEMGKIVKRRPDYGSCSTGMKMNAQWQWPSGKQKWLFFDTIQCAIQSTRESSASTSCIVHLFIILHTSLCCQHCTKCMGSSRSRDWPPGNQDPSCNIMHLCSSIALCNSMLKWL